MRFHCGWCGDDFDTGEYNLSFNRAWGETVYWARCPSCGERVSKTADDYIEIVREDDEHEDATEAPVQ